MAHASQFEGERFPRTRSDASEHIALEIRRYLERHGLQPGDRIGTEQELAAEFGVSRPTLREGLRLLASSHLIRVGRGRAGGIFVARNANEETAARLQQAIDDAEGHQPGTEPFNAADARFHQILAEAAGNELLI